MATRAATVRGTIASEARRANAGFWSDTFARLRRDPTTMAALAVLGVMVVLAAAADLLAERVFHMTLAEQDLLRTYQKPTLAEPAYWLGSDGLGRSQIVRLFYGARVSLFIGIVGALVALGIGVVLGMSAAYIGGRWDDFVVWLVTTLNGIPLLFLLILVGVYFNLTPLSLAVLIGCLGWLGICNLSRGQTFALREREYVLAARALGASPPRIMVRHILPNLLPLMIVVVMLNVGGIILGEAALSFLGFGIQPPQPSWGNMLSGATEFYYRGPHLIVVPGIAITTTVLCLYLVGDGLRDALDPRLGGTTGARRD